MVFDTEHRRPIIMNLVTPDLGFVNKMPTYSALGCVELTQCTNTKACTQLHCGYIPCYCNSFLGANQN